MVELKNSTVIILTVITVLCSMSFMVVVFDIKDSIDVKSAPLYKDVVKFYKNKNLPLWSILILPVIFAVAIPYFIFRFIMVDFWKYLKLLLNLKVIKRKNISEEPSSN